MNRLPIIRKISLLRKQVEEWRREGSRIALVPTMGALHEGHLTLMRASFSHADRVIATIFVNPKQFGPKEDFASYPRCEDRDAALMTEAGVSLLYAPDVDEMYPEGFASNVTVSGVTEGLCGAHRLGHFDGVATVVSKLLLQARPDAALFGEKDYQQLQVIARVVRDLDIGVEIIGHPIVREKDGLAMSSRNAYLTPAEREQAPCLYRTLCEIVRRLRVGEEFGSLREWGEYQLKEAGFGRIDYLALCDSCNLTELEKPDRPARLIAAAFLGKARLLDNMDV